jgi:hypothetical protein
MRLRFAADGESFAHAIRCEHVILPIRGPPQLNCSGRPNDGFTISGTRIHGRGVQATASPDRESTLGVVAFQAIDTAIWARDGRMSPSAELAPIQGSS